MKNKELQGVLAPVGGRVISLDEVPDTVFSERILGDGCAIVPNGGLIYSPIDGVVDSVAESRHAYGFRSDDGQEILVHIGIDTVSLEGEGFHSRVKVGDRVKAGDPVAEVDWGLIAKEKLSPITPVLICSLSEDEKTVLLREVGSTVDVGTPLLRRNMNSEQTKVKKRREGRTRSKKDGREGSFDFLQRLGKVLMVVIAVMPAAGLAISIGKLVAMAGTDVALLSAAGGRCNPHHGHLCIHRDG